MMKKMVCVGLTMKSIDYFEFGLPLINNIKGDTWDIIEKEKCGINISIDNETLKENIVSYYSNDMRSNSRKVFEKKLSEKTFCNLLESLIEELKYD